MQVKGFFFRILQETILLYFPPSLSYLFVLKTFVLSIFEWPLKTGFTVLVVEQVRAKPFREPMKTQMIVCDVAGMQVGYYFSLC